MTRRIAKAVRSLWSAALGLGLAPGFLLAQGSDLPSGREPAPGFYSAPGNYGTYFGTPSFGLVRSYSEFSSPYGAGYAYGYPPPRLLPGAHGVGLWRVGGASPFEASGASANSYRTFALPYNPRGSVPTPPMGVYAPAFGPSRPYPPSAYFGR